MELRSWVGGWFWGKNGGVDFGFSSRNLKALVLLIGRRVSLLKVRALVLPKRAVRRHQTQPTERKRSCMGSKSAMSVSRATNEKRKAHPFLSGVLPA